MVSRVTISAETISREKYRKLLGDRPCWVENPEPELLAEMLPHLNPQQRRDLEEIGGKVVLPSLWAPFVTHVAELHPCTPGVAPAILYLSPYDTVNKGYFAEAEFAEEAEKFVTENWSD